MPRPLLIGLLLLTVLRLVVANATAVTPDEAELWLAARHPAAGYFSSAPWSVWMTWIATNILGDGAAGVRFFAPWLVLAASWLAWRLTFALFGEAAAAWLVAVLQLVPLVNLAAVRDSPGAWAFIWAVLALWWWWQALHRASPWAWQWLAAGAAMGLAALSDIAGWCLPFSLLGLLAVPRRWRRQLTRPGPWLSWGVMLIVLIPWFMWQRETHWLAWRTHWLAATRQVDLAGFLTWLGHLVLALSPLLLAGIGWAGWLGFQQGVRSWKRRREGGLGKDDPLGQKDGRVFLLAAVAPVAGGAVLLGFMGRGTLSLAALPAFAALMFLVARWITAPLPPTLRRLTQNATLILAAVYSLAALHSDLFRHCGLRWLYGWDPTAATAGWSALPSHLHVRAKALANRENGSDAAVSLAPFCLTESPRLAAQLCYLGREWRTRTEDSPVLIANGLVAQPLASAATDNDFALWPGYASPAQTAAYLGRDALFFHEGELAPEQLARLHAQFERLEDGGLIELRRGGLPVRRLSCLVARRFRGLPQP